MRKSDLIFDPKSSEALAPYMALANTLVNDYGLIIGRCDDATHAYTMGCMTGSLSFAMAAQSGEVDNTLIRCKLALLVQLGLSAGNLTSEQMSQRGYICGLFESIEQAFLVAEQGENENA